MTSEANRWQRVRHVFQATLERPDANRPRFLREACTGDSDERFLMNVVSDETNFPPITIVQNWTALLRK